MIFCIIDNVIFKDSENLETSLCVRDTDENHFCFFQALRQYCTKSRHNYVWEIIAWAQKHF